MTVLMPCYIVNTELLELTKEAIFSLGSVDNLVIIDNGSELGGGYLRALADVYIRNKDNLGYAKAVNQGLRICEGDEYIAVANNDIRVSPNWQEVVKDVLKEPDTFTCHLRMTDYDIPFAYGTKTQYVGKERWGTGSFFVIRSLEPMYYDERFLNSYDDWDFFHTIRSLGYKTAYTDKACYQHHHSTTQQLIPTREEANQKNREYFKEKWGEYPEDLFAALYPHQMRQDYLSGFSLDAKN